MSFKKVRNMTVYYQYPRWDKKDKVPTIRLKGNWLKEIGFEVGDKIEVECEEGRLVIRKKIEN